MSIDIDILPSLALPTWGAVRLKWQSLIRGQLTEARFEPPELLDFVGKVPVGLDYQFDVGFNGFFEGSPWSTLALSVVEIEPDGRRPYVEDYASNLVPSDREQMLSRWSGPLFMADSLAGRPPFERSLLLTLGCAIASCTEGWVMISDGTPFSLGRGAYAGDSCLRRPGA